MRTWSVQELVTEARRLVVPGERHILGITGAPGAGKSTLAAQVVAALGAQAALVSMDGFHLANSELDRLGLRNRKGSPDTFDAAGYVALLRRLRQRREDVVYAPLFDRMLDESVGSAVPVSSDVPLVVTEGNFLLHDTAHWPDVGGLLDECWYVEIKTETRVARLSARHETYGRSPAEALAWANGTDAENALVVERSKPRATLVVQL